MDKPKCRLIEGEPQYNTDPGRTNCGVGNPGTDLYLRFNRPERSPLSSNTNQPSTKRQRTEESEISTQERTAELEQYANSWNSLIVKSLETDNSYYLLGLNK
jgi:hypothetical protein